MARYVSIALVLSMVLPRAAMAGEHLVAPAESAARLQAAAADRASNPSKIQRGVSLSGEERRDLVGRADALQADPVAGGTRKTLIIVGVVVVVAVLLAAAIVDSCKEQRAECFK